MAMVRSANNHQILLFKNKIEVRSGRSTQNR